MTNKRIKTGVRLRDVATAAGVSSATVSAVVNGRAQQYGICQATQEKVQGLIRQMGYSPSLAALDMAAGRNSLVGLAVSTDFPAADRLMASLEPALAQSGFRLVVAYLPPDPQAASTSSPQVASARITSLLQFGIAGLVVCPSESLVLPKITCPAIIVGRPGAGLPAVYEDEAEGGRRLARRLLEKGHRHVAILRDAAPTTQQPSNLATASSRTLAGFLEACAQGGATTRCFNSVAEFLPVSGSVTAVFCGSSSVVLELYSRGLSAGLRLGSSLAVVAVDRLGVAAYLVPRPTVLKPGGNQLGQAAARLIQQAITGARPGDIQLEPVLVDGDSIPVLTVSTGSPQVVSVPYIPPVAPKPSVVTPASVPVKPVVVIPAVIPVSLSGTGDLSAPNSPLPATPPPDNQQLDNSTTASPSPEPVEGVPGGTESESATPVAETEVTQAFVSDEEINPHPNPLPSQGEGVSLPQDTAISPSEALQMPEPASDVPTVKEDN